MAAVEGQQGQQVEHPDEDVDVNQQDEHVGGADRGRLRADAGHAVDRQEPVLVGMRAVEAPQLGLAGGRRAAGGLPAAPQAVQGASEPVGHDAGYGEQHVPHGRRQQADRLARGPHHAEALGAVVGRHSEEAADRGRRMDQLGDHRPLDHRGRASAGVDDGDVDGLADAVPAELDELRVGRSARRVEALDGQDPVPFDEPDDPGRALLGEALAHSGRRGAHLAVADIDHLDLGAGQPAHMAREVREGGAAHAADRDQLVAGLQAGRRGRAVHRDAGQRPLLHLVGLGAVARQRPSVAEEHREQQHQRDDEVHSGTGRQHEQLLGVALPAEAARLVLGGHRVEVVHPGDAHVGTRPDRLDAVFGLAAAERPQPRAEPDEELGDLHPGPAGGEVVAELVQEQDGDQRQDDHHPAHPGADAQQREQREQAGEAAVVPQGRLHHVAFIRPPRGGPPGRRPSGGRPRRRPARHRRRRPGRRASVPAPPPAPRRSPPSGSGRRGRPERPPRWRR